MLPINILSPKTQWDFVLPWERMGEQRLLFEDNPLNTRSKNQKETYNSLEKILVQDSRATALLYFLVEETIHVQLSLVHPLNGKIAHSSTK